MSPDRTPWWYSGSDDENTDEPESASPSAGSASAEAADEPTGSLDWNVLALGAQRLVDWASERLLTPHAEHLDPREHPDCVVCRTQRLLGETGTSGDAGAGDEAPDPIVPGPRPAPIVEWIPIVEP